MRYLAPPPSQDGGPSAERGRALFNQAGCALCHTPTLANGRGKVRRDVLTRRESLLRPRAASHGPGISTMASIKATPKGRIGEPRRSGDSATASSSCTTDARSDLLDAIRLHDSPGSEAHRT